MGTVEAIDEQVVADPVVGNQHVMAGRGILVCRRGAIVDADQGGGACCSQGCDDAKFIVGRLGQHRAWGQIEQDGSRGFGGVEDAGAIG